jgi:hypothetical protein
LKKALSAKVFQRVADKVIMAAKKTEKSAKLNPTEVATILRGISREQHKGMKPGGFHSSPKGKRGYTRKTKHKKGEEV